MNLNTNKLINRFKEEVKAFYNFNVIIEKALKDKYIEKLMGGVRQVFESELNYAVKELIKMKKQPS